MKLAIHQPDFIPWMGLFHKIALCSHFVLFDHIYAPLGKSWHNRNKLLINDEPKWITLPIERKGRGNQRYADIEIAQNFNRDKQLRSIELAYKKTDFFDHIFPLVQELYDPKFTYLLDMNMYFLRAVTQGLNIETEFIDSRNLAEQNPALYELNQNDLVLQICIDVGATKYVSGKGCLDFIQPDSFESKGITFEFQEFEHPEYVQKNYRKEGFVSHLSILDALFNLGFDGTRRVMGITELEH